MKHIRSFITIIALAAASVCAQAEQVKVPRGEARDMNRVIGEFDRWLSLGAEQQVADGDKQKVIRKPYELDAATRFALAKAKRATQTIADDLDAVENAKQAEYSQAPSKDFPQGSIDPKARVKAAAEVAAEAKKEVTIDVTLIDAGAFNRFADKVPITVFQALAPILKNTPQ